MADTRCSVCGCTQFRLDPCSNVIRCMICGTSQTAQQDLLSRQSYMAAKRMAVAHVRRGAYQQAIPHLNEMLRADPNDVDVYYLHLMGLTNFLKDNLVPGGTSLEQAAEHYRSYRNLGGRTQQFARYRIKRLEALEQLIQHQAGSAYRGVALRVFCLIAGGVLLWDCWLMWPACGMLFYWLIYSLFDITDPLGFRHLRRLRQALRTAKATNEPFFKV